MGRSCYEDNENQGGITSKTAQKRKNACSVPCTAMVAASKITKISKLHAIKESLKILKQAALRVIRILYADLEFSRVFEQAGIRKIPKMLAKRELLKEFRQAETKIYQILLVNREFEKLFWQART